jgi:hypothetical protein
MSTPAQAFAWELWSRHHRRLLIIAGLLLGFALLYPALCSQASLDLSSPNPFDPVAEQFASTHRVPSLQVIVRLLYCLALACAPAGTMIVTLLFVGWMFTFTMVDPQTKDPMKFPSRLFNLPVSTGYIFAWLVVAGQLAVVALYCCWHYFVRFPKLEMFGSYDDGLAWMSLLAIAQGIAWAMASWPKTRMLILTGIGGFVLSPTWRDYKGAEFVLPALLVLGLCLGYVGLRKMRQGEWQGVDWERLFSKFSRRGTMRGPRQFTSPAQAQLWFEWRRFARTLCLVVAGLTVLPVVLLILTRFIFRLDPFPDDTISGLASYLIGVPILVHLAFGVSPGLTQDQGRSPTADLSFVLNRPLTDGRIVMTILKAAGIFTAISWLLVCLSLLALRLLGNFAPPEGNLEAILVKYRLLAALGLIVLSWRLAVINLCSCLSNRPRLRVVPGGLLMCAYFLPIALYLLSLHQDYWDAFCRVLPFILIFLIAVKMVLAGLAFRNALHRRLLSPSEMIGYVSVWALIVAATAIPVLVMLHGQSWAMPLVLCAILVAPLARIGFSPITLAWQRHQ